MGLDLTVSINGLKDTSKYEKYNNEEMDMTIDESSVSMYYRLNWSGVGAESRFLSVILFLETLPLAEKAKRKISKSQIKNNELYVVKGISYSRYSGRYNVETVVKGKNLKRCKNNCLMISERYNKNKIYQFEIYKLDKKELINRSMLDYIAIGAWNGSNGEMFYIQKENEEIVCNSIYEDYENEEAAENGDYEMKEAEVSRLNSEVTKLYSNDIYETDKMLDIFLERKPKHYIADKSKVLSTMLKDMLENDGVSLSSNFF